LGYGVLRNENLATKAQLPWNNALLAYGVREIESGLTKIQLQSESTRKTMKKGAHAVSGVHLKERRVTKTLKA